MLAGKEFAGVVRLEEQFWMSRGISGVPAMVFDNTVLITGARGVSGYAQVLRHIVKPKAA